jgi:hypothetical protein
MFGLDNAGYSSNVGNFTLRWLFTPTNFASPTPSYSPMDAGCSMAQRVVVNASESDVIYIRSDSHFAPSAANPTVMIAANNTDNSGNRIATGSFSSCVVRA